MALLVVWSCAQIQIQCGHLLQPTGDQTVARMPFWADSPNQHPAAKENAPLPANSASVEGAVSLSHWQPAFSSLPDKARYIPFYCLPPIAYLLLPALPHVTCCSFRLVTHRERQQNGAVLNSLVCAPAGCLETRKLKTQPAAAVPATARQTVSVLKALQCWTMVTAQSPKLLLSALGTARASPQTFLTLRHGTWLTACWR